MENLRLPVFLSLEKQIGVRESIGAITGNSANSSVLLQGAPRSSGLGLGNELQRGPATSALGAPSSSGLGLGNGWTATSVGDISSMLLQGALSLSAGYEVEADTASSVQASETCDVCGKPAEGRYRPISFVPWFVGCKAHLEDKYAQFKGLGELVWFRGNEENLEGSCATLAASQPTDLLNSLDGPGQMIEVYDEEDWEAELEAESEQVTKCYACKLPGVALFKAYRPRAKWIICCAKHLGTKVDEWRGNGQIVELIPGEELEIIKTVSSQDVLRQNRAGQPEGANRPIVYFDDTGKKRVLCTCGDIATLVVTARNEDGILGSGALCEKCKNIVQAVDPGATWKPIPEATGILPINKPSNARPPTAPALGPHLLWDNMLHLNQNHWNRNLPLQVDVPTRDLAIRCQRLGCRNVCKHMVLLEFKGGDELQPTYLCHQHAELERTKARIEGKTLREYPIDPKLDPARLGASQEWGLPPIAGKAASQATC
jgi:hypothetical protein